MTNPCPHTQEDLKAYADRELPWPRRLAVRRHLAHCAACRKELTAMTQIADDLHAAESPDTALDPALRAKLLTAMPASLFSPEVKTRGRSFRLPSAWQLAGVGAIVFVLWAVLFPVFHPFQDHGQQMAATSVRRRQIGLSQLQYSQDTDEAYPAAAAPVAARQTETLTRQVHKEATLTVQVADAEAQGDKVAQIVKGAGGFVADNTLNTDPDGGRAADLTAKVPVVQFETVLGQLTKLGEVQAKNITGEDITEKTSDADQAEGVLEDEARRADARLKTLGEKAGWDAQQDAQNTRIQLAQARARLLLLRKMAVLSTISIHLAEKPKPAAAPVTGGFWPGLADSTRAATGALLASTEALLSLLIWLLAFAPLWLPLALIGRHVYQRQQAKGVA